MPFFKKKDDACEVTEEVSDNLKRLRALSEDLKDYRGFVQSVENNVMELETVKGKAVLTGLYNEDDLAVCLNRADAETEWPSHYHDEWECFIVVSGEMHFFIDGKCAKVIKPRQLYWFQGKQLHHAYFPEKTFFVAITIPAAEGFPKGVI